MTKMGRPKTKIDKENFEKLCGLQCTEIEIADFFNCSIDTINNWCKETYGETFSDTFKKKSASGKRALRRTQFKLAEKNASMAIFLGKQYLGQRDYVEDESGLDKVEELLTKLSNEAKIDEKSD